MNGLPPIFRSALPLLIAVAYFVVMVPFGSRLILHFPDERHYAYAGARMVETGEYLTPRTPAGDLRLKKPIVPYWLAAAGFTVLGIGVPGLRLFWLVSACCILLLTYRLARALGAAPRTALLAELMLAGNPVFLHSSVVSNPDIPLTLFMTLSAIGFVTILSHREAAAVLRRATWLAWIGAAVAFLVKGIIAILFAGFAVVAIGILDRRRLALVLRPVPMTCAALLAASWYVYALLLYPETLGTQFFQDQVGDKAFRYAFGPLLAFPGYLIASVASFLFPPFLLLLCFPRAVLSPRVRSWPTSIKLLAGWCIALAATFSIGGWVEIRYALPVLPIVAALLAKAFEAVDGEHFPLLSRAARSVLSAVSVLGLLVLVGGAVMDVELANTGEAAGLFLVGGALWIAVAVAAFRHPGLAPFLLPATPALTVAVLTLPLMRLVLPDLSAPLADRLVQMQLSPDKAAFVGDVHEASALRLYAGRADPFRYAQTATPDMLDEVCVVMTDQATVADMMRLKGFQVETLQAGWRKIEPSALFYALLSGHLAEARLEHGDKGYFAVAPNAASLGCGASLGGPREPSTRISSKSGVIETR